jgi:hypothetical protein
MNTYDCNLFDKEGACFSVGGRHTDVDTKMSGDSSSSAGVFVWGKKLNDNFRVSGFVDQQFARSNPTGIQTSNKGPMVGANIVWNQHPNQMGYQVRLANAYQVKDMTITRSPLGIAEAGRGDTEIQVQSYIAEVSYQFGDEVKTSFKPYAAMRRALVKQDGYTEADVANPLTFNTLEDKTTTAIVGVKAMYRLNKHVILNTALGVEHDISRRTDKIEASSSTISGLTPVNIANSVNGTRPVITAGATYLITPTQSVSIQTQYQELSYTDTSSKTVYINYTIGL